MQSIHQNCTWMYTFDDADADASYIFKRQYPCYTIGMSFPRKLPIGVQSFKVLRNDRYLYVDKTAYIAQLITGSRSSNI